MPKTEKLNTKGLQMDWNPILNWKLMDGSHKFPGPDGGTCINEAAIVAAGFKYRAVQSAHDCPPCFSRVIAGYALGLNDAMDDKLRQELLMPYVVRLAGTADAREIEIARAEYIVLETIRRILPIALRAVGLNNHAAHNCAGVKDLKAADAAARAAANAANAANAAYAAANAAANAAYDAAYDTARAAAYAAYAANAAARAVSYADNAAARAAPYAANAAYAAARAVAHADNAVVYAARRKIFTIAVAILDEAICLGKQADPIEIGVVTARMEVAKQRRRVIVSVGD